LNDELTAILKKVRRLELRTRSLVSENLAGEYQSSFRGQGMDFHEFREYTPGDDTRAIDWNVTARMNTPFIRTFIEERELTVMLAVDVSPSLRFASGPQSKRDLAAELAALLGFSAIQNNDKVGMVLFSHEADRMFLPAKQRNHMLRLLREMLAAKPSAGETRITPALDAINHALPRRSLVILISDMLSDDIEETIKRTARRHDLLVLQIKDRAEALMGARIPLLVEDPETGRSSVLSPLSKPAAADLQRRLQAADQQLATTLKRAGAGHIVLHTNEDYLPALHGYLRQRARTRPSAS